jgi:hypothetical protein
MASTSGAALPLVLSAVPEEPTLVASLQAPSCIICANAAPIRCSVCQAAHYYSPECQATDKFVHGELCRPNPNFNDASRRRTVRAIFFDCTTSAPRFFLLTRLPEVNIEIPRLVGEHCEIELIDYNKVRNRALQLPIRGFFEHHQVGAANQYNSGLTFMRHGSKWWDNIAFNVHR